jgi:hypothetical protein
MTARREDLTVEQGADYQHDFPVLDEQARPRTLTGWTAEASVRYAPDSPLIATLGVLVRPGSVRLTIPGSVSAGWSWRRARYEVRLVGPQGQRERLAAGRVLLDRSL